MLKIKKILLLAIVGFLGFASLAASSAVLADSNGSSEATSGIKIVSTGNTDPCHPELHHPAGNRLTTSQLASCEACKNKSNTKDCLTRDPIVKDLNLIINVLAGLVAVVSIAMIVLGGIQYSIARNNPQEIGAARGRIINAVIAMIAFMFLWALLQYLIPGGVFNS